jgi:hypothetical protein
MQQLLWVALPFGSIRLPQHDVFIIDVFITAAAVQPTGVPVAASRPYPMLSKGRRRWSASAFNIPANDDALHGVCRTPSEDDIEDSEEARYD